MRTRPPYTASGDLFEHRRRQDGKGVDPAAPLADRMRPRTLDEVVGHATVLTPGGFLRTKMVTGINY